MHARSPSGVVRRAVKVVAAAADRARPPAPGIVFLIYHRVGAGTGGEVDLPTPSFAEQMESIAPRAVSIDDALAILDGSAPATVERPVVVTFDDGTADFGNHAVEVLVRCKVPATLYVATDFVESGRSFPNDGRPVSWSALADAVSTGLVTIGSHTHTHRVLGDVDAAAAADELDRSIGLIEDRLGLATHHFAYPKAVDGSDSARQAVAARFRSAALAGGRPNRYGANPLRLQRTPVQVSDAGRWFERKAAGGMLLEEVLRRRVDRIRYRGTRH